MGVISESAIWEDSVLQIEVGDSVGGGPSAVANLQAQDLANRTKFLKGKVDLLLARVPVGALVTMPVNDVPDHCFECNGAEISRATYPELFAVIGTTYGEGDGSTTFQIPDLRGEFIRGWDHGRGLDGTLDRAIATTEEDSISKDDLTMNLQRSKGGSSTAMPLVNGGNNYELFNANGASTLYTGIATNGSFIYGGNETRPHNVAMMYCIVYE